MATTTIKTIKSITTTTYLEIHGKHIEAMLKDLGHIPEEAENISITFIVPGGGDYSNMSLGIDKFAPIKVSFKVTEEVQPIGLKDLPPILKPQNA